MPPEAIHEMAPGQRWLGFNSLDELLSTKPSGDPVFVIQINTTSAHGTMGIEIRRHYVMVQASIFGSIGYMRIPVGVQQMVAGKPLSGSDAVNMLELSKQVVGIVREELSRRGVPIVEALFAAPHDLRMLDADPDFVRYDTTTRSFVRNPSKPIQS